MIRILITVIGLLFFVNTTHAQASDVEAKAAYLLAEDSYGKGDYKAALNYLNDARKSLGKTNAKMMYLQIQVEMELMKTDTSFLRRAFASIGEFEALPDYKDFNEEKIIEVAKSKLLLRNVLKERDEEMAEKNAVLAHGEKTLAEWNFIDWPFGGTIETLRSSFPGAFIFKKKLKQQEDPKYGVVINHSSDIHFKNFAEHRFPMDGSFHVGQRGLVGILTRNGMVKGYLGVEMYSMIYPEAPGTNAGARQFKEVVDRYTSLFGKPPVIMNQRTQGETALEDLVWETAGKKVVLEHRSWSWTNRTGIGREEMATVFVLRMD